MSRVTGDHDPSDGEPSGADRLGQRVHHDVGPVLERPHERGRRDRGVHDERDAVAVREIGDLLDVEAGLLGVGWHLAVQKARVVIDDLPPGLDVPRFGHPANLRPALPHPEVEELIGSAVDLGGGHEVDALPWLAGHREQWLDGLLDGGHAGGRCQRRSVGGASVRLQQGQGLLQVEDGRVVNSRVAPGGDQVTEPRLHLVAVSVRL